MKRAIVFLVVFLLLAGLISGLSYFQFVLKPNIIKTAITHAPRPVASVAVAEAASESWVPRIPAIGTFHAVQGIDVAPQVAGIVRAVKFDSGQEVAKGAPLIEIDDSTEQTDLQSGLAQMRNADFVLSRQKQLMESGNTARATLDQAQATRDTAAASVDHARVQIAQKNVTAPFAGRLGLRKVDVGQYVSPGTALVSLTELDPIQVDFPLPEQALATVRVGQRVEIRVDGYPDETFAGAIKSIDARVSQDSRSVLVRAELPNPSKRLLPGMFADVAVVAGAARAVVAVPRTAIAFSLYGDSVFVAVPPPPQPADGAARGAEANPENAIAQRRFVRTGEAHGDSIAVLDGVKPGEKVITEGQVKLLPDAPVRIDPTAGLPSRTVLPNQ